ncbi:hypothetical protein F441_06026 [Phytophthora nicotianae CJ01A1]|nr:hypothetical protein L915_05890 [Phytophthora nicotianae]ETL43722.1 hypothetical protein L916_05825 [Phytophthora nicotianae]ETP20194.1 hypothetical protein F441_06026 [Phytophthora nicotianae CJ01A1]
MMAASPGFTGTPTGHSDGSTSFPPSQEANHSSNEAAGDEFGSFAAAERLSDPFGDVYGAEADFGDFMGQEQSDVPSAGGDSSSLMSFSPVTAPASSTAPPKLLPSISGEVDPFADITGGLGAATDSPEVAAPKPGTVEKFQSHTSTTTGTIAPTSTSSATSAILDLVWGNSTQDTETNPLSMSSTSVGSASGNISRTASSPSGFALPPPPSTKFATFPSTSAAATPEASVGDLLSFSPVQAPASSDPFFGISNETSETNAAFGNDELFTLTATPPHSTTSSSAPTSLRGSFASMHEELKPPVLSPSTPESTASPLDPFSERTTRSFGSLNSSFVKVGTMEDAAQKHASFGGFISAKPEAGATSSVAPSPSSAPPSLRSSFMMTEEFVGFASAAEESDEVDPFAEAGLAAPVEVPLAEALAAWNTSADPAVDTEEGESSHDGKCEEEVVAENKNEEIQSPLTDGTVVTIEQRSDSPDIIDQTKAEVSKEESHDDWQEPGTSDHSDDVVTDDVFAQEELAAPAIDSPAAVAESESPSFMAFTEAIEGIAATKSEDSPIADTNDDEVHAGVPISPTDEVVWSAAEQSTIEEKADHSETKPSDPFTFSTPTTIESLESAGFGSGSGVSDESSSRHDSLSASPSVSDTAPAGSDNFDEGAAVETLTEETQDKASDDEEGDDFGGFGGFEAAAPTTSATIIPDASPWGSFPSPTPVQNMLLEDEDESFGDFAGKSTPVSGADDFADFAQSTELNDDDEFGDFGDFTQSSDDKAFGENDDGFGDFAPAVAPTSVEATPSVMSVPSFTKTDLSSFFKEAFATEPIPTSSVEEPDSPTEVNDADAAQDSSTEFIQYVFRSMWDEYISIVAATGRQSSLSAPEPNDSGERVRLCTKTTRASKYLKYVLSEKIQEAARQNGIFSHGSEKHQTYIGYAASGDADCMRSALKELQDALFHSSVNDAMMRIAKQAALSAKAKIAEQAAQQQASSRGGSLFSTTRHLLSRGGATAAHGPSSNDSKGDHAGADTPTGASVQKLARFSFTNSNDDAANRGTGEERGSEGSDHTGHSSGSDSEAPDSRTRSQTLSSSSSNGGLMKKFLSFGSSRHRPRFVNLRRKGQSGEEVRKMELNLDSISGGLDEVKWKCAMFLYDVEEVAHVAPSQISILSYPSKQPLTGKTDRSALTKLVKADTIWTVDIGANHSDMLNEW